MTDPKTVPYGPRRLLVRGALIATAVLMSGCACNDADWESMVVSDAGAFETLAAPDCEGDKRAQFSKASAGFMERADPLMLEIARLEAERDCYKAAERRARELALKLKS
jgi:hypothetical protein